MLSREESTGFFYQCTSGLDFEMGDQKKCSLNIILGNQQLLSNGNSCGYGKPIILGFVLLFSVYEIAGTVQTIPNWGLYTVLWTKGVVT